MTGNNGTYSFTGVTASSLKKGMIIVDPLWRRDSTISSIDEANNSITLSSTFGKLTNRACQCYYHCANETGSHVEGSNNIANGMNAHAEGNGNVASSDDSHAEGQGNVASGLDSHAEGQGNVASGEESHTEGLRNTASGVRSHAEGNGNVASGECSHTEGLNTISRGKASHAEGVNAIAYGNYSHAEGGSIASTVQLTGSSKTYTISIAGNNSLIGQVIRYNNIIAYITTYSEIDASSSQITVNTSLGTLNSATCTICPGPTAIGQYSHAEGYCSVATGSYSHAEGNNTRANANSSHAEGYNTKASGQYQHVSGKYNVEDLNNTYAEIVGIGTGNTRKNGRTLDWYGNEVLAGKLTVGTGPSDQMDVATKQYADTKANKTDTVLDTTLSRGRMNDSTVGEGSYAFGDNVIASGANSHAEGAGTKATGPLSHAEGSGTTASGNVSHTEGGGSTASGEYSHAEGGMTTASGEYSHAEGFGTSATNSYSHAEGGTTKATGALSHAEGGSTTAAGALSHAEGSNTIASGNVSHAEGYNTTASGVESHAEGHYTIAKANYSHVSGQYNVEDLNNTYAEIIGIGTSNSSRKNGRTLDWSGNEQLAGSLTLGLGTTDQTTVTAAQLKQLLSNPMIVNATFDNDNQAIVLDKTYTVIKNAFASGINILIHILNPTGVEYYELVQSVYSNGNGDGFEVSTYNYQFVTNTASGSPFYRQVK